MSPGQSVFLETNCIVNPILSGRGTADSKMQRMRMCTEVEMSSSRNACTCLGALTDSHVEISVLACSMAKDVLSI